MKSNEKQAVQEILSRGRMVADRNRRVSGVEIGHTPGSLVYFFCAISEIISSWNSDECLVSNLHLRRQVESKYRKDISESDWKILLNSFAAERIDQRPNTMRFLLYGADDKQLIVNYPAIEAFLTSAAGQQFAMQVKEMVGTSLGTLRRPAQNEAEWVAWLKSNFPLPSEATAQPGRIEEALQNVKPLADLVRMDKLTPAAKSQVLINLMGTGFPKLSSEVKFLLDNLPQDRPEYKAVSAMADALRAIGQL